MNQEQRAHALRLAGSAHLGYRVGWQREVASLLRELAAEPRKRTEQDAFEEWLEKERPSGDVTEVQRQWESSSELAEFLDEQREQAEPERVPLTDEQITKIINSIASNIPNDADEVTVMLSFIRAVEREHGIV